LRTHGWGGEPPADDAEAQRRILAAAQRLIDELGPGIESFPTGAAEPDEVVTEAVARVLAQLPHERYLWVMLTSGRASLFSRGVTSPMSLNFGREIVERLPVDWARHGVDAADLAELTEHVVRTIQSFMLDPGSPPRGDAQLRDYLQHWLAPGVRQLTARAGAP
jgi:hypothetical protein